MRPPVTFDEMYARHAAEVVRTAFAVLHDAALAEDVAQEVFMAVWRRASYDERRGPLGPYLRLLARSRALDLWRRTRAADRMQRQLEDQAGTAGARPLEPDAALARGAERRVARAAVRRLPDEQRQAIGLTYWGGLSAQQVASAEGIPLGTAKSRVRLGLQKLASDPDVLAAA